MSWVFWFILFTLVSVAYAVVLVLLTRRHPKSSLLYEGTGGVEGSYVTVVGGTYAIILAFMVVVVWTRYDDAGSTVDQEANTLATIYRLSQELPETSRLALQDSVYDYLIAVTGDEWVAMRQGDVSLRTWRIVNGMWSQINTILLRQEGDIVVREELLSSFVRLTSLRRERLYLAETGIPTVMWTVLIIGGLLTISFAAVFGVGGLIPHLMKAAIFAALVAMVLFLIWALGNPFMGPINVETDAFQLTREVIQQYQE